MFESILNIWVRPKFSLIEHNLNLKRNKALQKVASGFKARERKCTVSLNVVSHEKASL